MAHCSLSLKLQRLVLHALCLHGLAIGAEVGELVNYRLQEGEEGTMVERKERWMKGGVKNAGR